MKERRKLFIFDCLGFLHIVKIKNENIKMSFMFSNSCCKGYFYFPDQLFKSDIYTLRENNQNKLAF